MENKKKKSCSDSPTDIFPVTVGGSLGKEKESNEKKEKNLIFFIHLIIIC